MHHVTMLSRIPSCIVALADALRLTGSATSQMLEVVAFAVEAQALHQHVADYPCAHVQSIGCCCRFQRE